MRRLTALVFALFACASCSEPPRKEIDRAQGAVETARAAGADRYAPAEFAAATTSLQQANDAVAARDHRLALLRALDAFERALQAARQAADGKARARSEAEVAIARTAGSFNRFEDAIARAAAAKLPAAVLAKARNGAATVESALQEARALMKEERFEEATAALKGMPEQINEEITAVSEPRPARPPRRRS
jgi:hypothetical protein